MQTSNRPFARARSAEPPGRVIRIDRTSETATPSAVFAPQVSVDVEVVVTSFSEAATVKECAPLPTVRRAIGTLATVEDLPVEITGYIFQLASEKHQSPFDKSSFARMVSQVCSYWRITALSTPFIWNSVLLDLSRDLGFPNKRRDAAATTDLIRSALTTWSERAGGVGVDLTITQTSKKAKFLDIGRLYMQVITAKPLCDRWKKITITSTAGYLSLTNEMRQTSFSELHSLSLGNIDLPGNLPGFHMDAPNLQALSLPAYHGLYNTDSFPWAGLRSLSVSFLFCARAEGIRVVGSAAATLEVLKLKSSKIGCYDCLMNGGGIQPVTGTFRLPKVHTLCIESHGTAVVDHFTMPALRRIRIDSVDCSPDWILRLLRHSHCTIRSLSVHVQDVVPHQFMQEKPKWRQLFGELAELDNLVAVSNYAEHTQAMAEILTVSRSGDIVLPSMTSLDIRVDGPLSGPKSSFEYAYQSASSIVALIDSRLDAAPQQCAKLTHLGLGHCKMREYDVIHRAVRRWRENGVEVNWMQADRYRDQSTWSFAYTN